MQDRDNRDWKRIAVDLQARCRAVDGPARYETARIINMHQQGCCLDGHMHFRKGQTVRIIVQVPFEGELNITGEAMWSGVVDESANVRTGIRFIIDSPPAEETCLKLYHYCLLTQPKK